MRSLRRFIGVLLAWLVLANAPGGPAVVAQPADEERTQLAGPLAALVDAVMTGEVEAPATGAATYRLGPAGDVIEDGVAADAAMNVAWSHDFLKATKQAIYVPFTVAVGASQLPSSSIVAYLRVAPRGATGPSGTSEAYPFEDAYITTGELGGLGQTLRFRRAFAVPAGDYDVYLAIRERPAADTADAGEPFAAAVLKTPVSVPDYWGGTLTTSSIILADRVEPLTAPVSPELQRDRPYVIGSTELHPAGDDVFGRTEELTVVFQVYNPEFGPDRKPDVTVEYAFLRQAPDGEVPFNNMQPQRFNTETLPPNFDPENGYQIAAGWTVPLDAFPEGRYRLAITVIDNLADARVTRDLSFTVAGS